MYKEMLTTLGKEEKYGFRTLKIDSDKLKVHEDKEEDE
jgi:hypothetical protein